MFSFYGQSFCLLIIFRRFDQHIPIRPFPPPYTIGYYAGPFAFKTTSCIATQVTDPTLDYCTNLIAFSLLGKGVYHILEWLSNSIISADKKIPRLTIADCPVKLYKSHFWLPTMLAYRNPHTWLYCRTTYFFLVGDSASRSFFILWRVSLSSLQHGFMEQFWFVNISSNKLTSVCPFLTAFTQVSATQRGVPG